MSKEKSRSSVDLISTLHDNLIQTILLKLPLRDAARTCILSKRWRHSWVKLPHLILDSAFWKQSMETRPNLGKPKFALIVSQIILLHQGSITYFRLDIPKNITSPEIDALISFVARNGVQTFVFHGDYKLPSSFFTCPTLNTLDLRFCTINNSPSSSGGLRLLTSLTLIDITISAQVLQTLLSSCPSLQVLHLRLPIDIRYLHFNFSKLNTLWYNHSLSNTESSLHQVNNLPKQGMYKLFGEFPCICTLFLDGRCFKSLVEGVLPMILPSPLLHLLSIDLHSIELKEEANFSGVLCLVKSSPNLQKFRIVVQQVANDNCHQLQEVNSCMTFGHLREVTVELIVGGRAEMKLIKMLLSKSPVLRKMNIRLATTNKAGEIVKIVNELFSFERASSNVKINIIE